MTTWDTVSHCQKKISPVSLNTFSLPRNRSWVKGLSLVDENRQNDVPLTFTTSSPSTIFNFSKFSWSSCGFIRHLSKPSKPTKTESRQAESLFTGLNCPRQDLPGPAYTPARARRACSGSVPFWVSFVEHTSVAMQKTSRELTESPPALLELRLKVAPLFSTWCR